MAVTAKKPNSGVLALEVKPVGLQNLSKLRRYAHTSYTITSLRSDVCTRPIGIPFLASGQTPRKERGRGGTRLLG